MKKLFISILFCMISYYSNAQTGYEIKINLKHCKDTLAFLTFYQFDKTMIKDTCVNIKEGKIIFSGKEKLEKGIYSLVSQQKSIYFDFFIDDDTQKLELVSDEEINFAKDLHATNAPRENDFLNYIKFIGEKSVGLVLDLKNYKYKNKADSTAYVLSKRKIVEKDIANFEENFLAKNKGTFMGNVMNLKLEKMLKDIPKASNGRPDSLMVYKYYKKHYWDNVDFKDDGTIKNPFFANKLKKYLDNIVVIHPDSVAVEIDAILDKTEFGSMTYKILLSHFIYTYETSKIMGFDKVFVHLSDRYFKTGKANGIYDDDNVVTKIIERSNKIRPLLVGAIAPELSMINATDHDKIAKMGFDTAKTSEEVTKLFYGNIQEIDKTFLKMSTVKAAYLLLLFWDVDCSHCQIEVPKILEQYHALQKEKIDFKVFSVYTQNDFEKYSKYIAEKKLDWINVYDGVHYNNIAEKYDVTSTPILYLLDKNKVIKAKKIGAEQIKDIVHALDKEAKLSVK